jgi:hypothetical protein
MIDEEERTSALLLNSTTWDRDGEWPRPRNWRVALGREALAWQNISRDGSHAESDAYPVPFRREFRRNGKTKIIKPRAGKAPREPNRMLELHGLMGAIGEQAGLAEAAAYFTLGAVHSVTNVVLRLLLLNALAAAVIEKAWPDSGGFPPLSDDRRAWITLNRYSVRDLGKAAGLVERLHGPVRRCPPNSPPQQRLPQPRRAPRYGLPPPTPSERGAQLPTQEGC